MLNKDQIKGRKYWIKKHMLLCLFENLEGSQVLYNQETGNWEIALQVGFELPEGMEVVERGFDEDVKREGIQQFINTQKKHLMFKLAEYMEATLKEEMENDCNLTYIFPPTFIAKQEGDAYRLKTEEEINAIAQEAPSLVDMMKRELELLKEGVYEFIPNTSIEEYEINAFRLKKYSSLRARFHISIPHHKIEGFNPESVEPIFQERKCLA